MFGAPRPDPTTGSLTLDAAARDEVAERHRDALAGDEVLESFDAFLEAPALGLDRMVSVVCTDHRLVLLDRGATVAAIPWTGVSAVGARRGLMFSMLNVDLADGTSFVLLNLPRRLAAPLAASLPPPAERARRG